MTVEATVRAMIRGGDALLSVPLEPLPWEVVDGGGNVGVAV